GVGELRVRQHRAALELQVAKLEIFAMRVGGWSLRARRDCKDCNQRQQPVWRHGADSTVSQTVCDPVSETVSDPVSETVCDSVSETVSDPVSETVCDPVSETVSDPVSETVSDPVSETVSDPVSETVCDPVSETVCDPVLGWAAPPRRKQKGPGDCSPGPPLAARHEQRTRTRTALPSSPAAGSRRRRAGW